MGTLCFYFFYLQLHVINNEFLSSDLTDTFTCLQTLSFGKGFILAVAIAVLPGTTGISPQIVLSITCAFYARAFILRYYYSKTIIVLLGQANLKKFDQIL